MAAFAFQAMIVIVESTLLLFRTRVIFYFMTLLNLYYIAFDLYAAYFSIGFLSYTFVLIYNSPYLLSLLRLFMRPDSVHRRKLLYNVCTTMYIIQISADLWVAINLRPQTGEICEAVVGLNKDVIE